MESRKVSTSSPSVKVSTLGRFSLEVSGKPVRFGAKVPRKSLELLKVLVALGGKGVSVETLQESLWPDSDGDRAQGAFASTLHRLRAIIGEETLLQADSRLTLNANCWVDSLAFNDLLKRVTQALDEQDSESALQVCEDILEIYQGPFLAGEFEPPEILSAREKLHGLFLHQLNRLGDFLTQIQAYADAIDLYQRGLQADDLAEEFYQKLMHCYAQQGRVAEAVSVYRRMEEALQAGAGIRPSLESEQLYNEIISTQGKEQAKETAISTAGINAAARGGTPAARTIRRPVIRRQTAALAVAAAFVLAATVAGGWYFYQQRASEAALAAFQREAAYPLPEKPSIAVLAFDNLSGDKEQEYFGDGIAEDIISDLSRINGIFVVARNSSFVFKGRPVDVAEVGRKLGVRYVLEGSVRKAGNRIRLSVQLVDAANRNHIWAERYERELKDVFSLQDEITEKIVDALQVELTMDEVTRLRRKSTENLQAWNHYQKGNNLYQRQNLFDINRAGEEFKQALKLDPEFDAASLGLAWTYFKDATCRGWVDLLYDVEEIARRIISQDKSMAEPYALLAAIEAFNERYDEAIDFGRRAVALHPNGALWHLYLAESLSLAGRTEEALYELNGALRLNPLTSIEAKFISGKIYYQAEQYEKAIALFQDLVATDRAIDIMAMQGWIAGNFRRHLIASYAASGNLEAARSAVAEHAEASRERGRQRIWYTKFWLSRMRLSQMDKIRMADDLRKAGMPD